MEAVLEELAPLCVGGKKTREAWEELNSLCGLLKANGLAERVYLDFSVEGDMGYYLSLIHIYSGVRRQLAPYGFAPDSRSLGWRQKRHIPFIVCRYSISLLTG